MIIRWRDRLRRRAVVLELGDRVQQAPTMTDRDDAHLLEIVGSQSEQDFSIDVILTECRLVLLLAQALQPSPDIHRRFLRAGDVCGRLYVGSQFCRGKEMPLKPCRSGRWEE